MNWIYADYDSFLAVTNEIDAAAHSHWMLQLFIPDKGGVCMDVDGQQIRGGAVLVGQDTVHTFGDGRLHLTMLIDPLSELGEQLTRRYLLAGAYHVFEAGLLAEGTLSALAKAAFSVDMCQKLWGEVLRVLGVPEKQGGAREERVAQVLSIIAVEDLGQLTVGSLANRMFLSQSRLSHLFRQATGVPLKSYLLTAKLARTLTELLQSGDVTTAALDAGFASPSHFAAACKKMTGMSATRISKDSIFLKAPPLEI